MYLISYIADENQGGCNQGSLRRIGTYTYTTYLDYFFKKVKIDTKSFNDLKDVLFNVCMYRHMINKRFGLGKAFVANCTGEEIGRHLAID